MFEDIKKKQDKEVYIQYGSDLKNEAALKDKLKEIEKYEKLNDLSQVNLKKVEYDVLLSESK